MFYRAAISFFIGVLLIASSLAQASNELTVFRPVHIVFDLDWTLFYSINSEDKDQIDNKVIEVESKHYRLTDHAEEMIRYLTETYPEVRISFFSGGEKSRNRELLKSMQINAEQTAFDIAEHIFDFQDLTRVSDREDAKFAERYKKLAENLIPAFKSEDVILIDDKPEFASPKLTAVSSFGQTTFTRNFEQSRIAEKYFAKSLEDWKLERNKALIWLGHIDQALQSRRKAQTAFSAVVKKKWGTEKSNYMAAGLEILRRKLNCQKLY